MDLSKYEKIAETDARVTLKEIGSEKKLFLKKSRLNRATRKELSDMPIMMVDGGEIPERDVLPPPEELPNSSVLPEEVVLNPNPMELVTSTEVPEKSVLERAGEFLQKPVFPFIAETFGADNKAKVSEPIPQVSVLQETPRSPASPEIQAQPQSMPNYGMDVMGAAISAEKKQIAAENLLAANQVKILEEQEKANKDLLDTYQSSFNTLNTKVSQFREALENKDIDPDRYVKNLSTGQKVRNAIGLLVGGLLGAGKEAAAYIQKQIDMDIDAQNKNMEKGTNQLKLLQMDLGNLKDAITFQKILSTEATAQKMKIDELKLRQTNPFAAARIEKTRAEMLKTLAPLYKDLSKSQFLAQTINRIGTIRDANQMRAALNAVRAYDPETANKLGEQIVFRGKNASMAVRKPDAAENKQLRANEEFQSGIDTLIDLSQKHGGLSWSQLNLATQADISAAVKSVQELKKKAADLGASLTESEAKFITEVIPDDVTGLFSGVTSLPRLKRAKEILEKADSILMNNLGIEVQAPIKKLTIPGINK